ncbi:MAG: hypothetical protein KBA66_11895 [Leptospiraceae bacterium]|nr:hypothetical protein [Leptospiraceae bacterium]
MKYKLIFILLAFSLLSQEKETPIYIHQSKNDPQYGANIRKSEEMLNKNISKANEALGEYSTILSMKIGTLPHKTILTKGITQGNDCLPLKKRYEPANCIKIEQFDFIEGERGEAQGQKNKSITLFFDNNVKPEGDRDVPSTGKLLKIKSRFFSHNIYTTDKKMVEVLDADPLGNPDHDDRIFITSQVDGESYNSSSEILEDGSQAGKYSLKSLENTKSNPLRNHFKREAYIKHLLSFEKILSKIFHSNETMGGKKEKQQ